MSIVDSGTKYASTYAHVDVYGGDQVGRSLVALGTTPTGTEPRVGPGDRGGDRFRPHPASNG